MSNILLVILGVIVAAFLVLFGLFGLVSARTHAQPVPVQQSAAAA